MSDDDFSEPDDPAFEIDRNDPALNTVRSLRETYDRIVAIFTTFLWPFFVIEEALLFVSMPITWALGGWLPYGVHVFRSTIRVLSFLGVPLGIGALIHATLGFPAPVSPLIDTGVTAIQTLSAYLQTTPVALAVAITAYYFISGILPYEPSDYQAWRTRHQPDAPYQWEFVPFTTIVATQLTLLVLLIEFVPSFLSTVPNGLLGLVALTIIVSFLAYWYLRKHFTRIWQKKDGDSDVHLELDTLLVSASFTFTTGTIALLVILSGVFGYINQTPTDMIMYAHLLGAWWLSRQFRLLLYQDRDGFMNINPRYKLWTITHRIPIAYALILTAVGGLQLFRSAPYAVELSTVPLLAILAYYPFRYYRLNGDMYAQYPRSLFDPDDWEIKEHVRTQFLNHEQRQALKPENRLSTQLTRTRHLGEEAAQGFVRADPDHFKPVSQLLSHLIKLDYETDATYDRRNKRIEHVRNDFQGLREKAKEYQGDNKLELLENLDVAEEALEEAHELNEEVGTRSIDYFKSWLF